MAPKQHWVVLAVLQDQWLKGKEITAWTFAEKRKIASDININFWLEKTGLFLLLESLFNTATWWLSSITLPYSWMQWDLSSDCFEILKKPLSTKCSLNCSNLSISYHIPYVLLSALYSSSVITPLTILGWHTYGHLFIHPFNKLNL